MQNRTNVIVILYIITDSNISPSLCLHIVLHSLERTLYSVVNAYIIMMMFIKAILFNKNSWQFNIVNLILRSILIK